jgi:dolichyl-phosphate beta-glucosyltransferase
MHKNVIVIPCYNEANRLDPSAFHHLVQIPGVDLLFVNDGSTDRTLIVLNEICATMESRATFLTLARNSGKAEAVRQGMLRALNSGADVVGYYDADLATPPHEMLRLIAVLDESEALVALASRVRLLGTKIERRALRHYLGRIFATAASLCIGIPIYDSQCGAKVFRAGECLREALANPFISRWGFDVELIGRLLTGGRGTPGVSPDYFLEMPLKSWRDVPGSKLHASDFPKTMFELVRITINLRRRAKGIAVVAPTT